MLAMRAESSRLIWPAPTPMVMPSLQNTMALDLTYLATFQANSRSCNWAAVGCTWVTTRISASVSSWLSAVCIKRPEPMRLTSTALRPRSQALVPRAAPPKAKGKAICSTRTLGLRAKVCSASGLKDGAISTSTNWALTCWAVAPSSSQLKAMMPPKADVGSVLKALA